MSGLVANAMMGLWVKALHIASILLVPASSEGNPIKDAMAAVYIRTLNTSGIGFLRWKDS